MSERATIAIRRGDGWDVKPDMEAWDGAEVVVKYGWTIGPEDSSLYAGEDAMIVLSPDHCPVTWIASGDLVPPREADLKSPAQPSPTLSDLPTATPSHTEQQ